MAEGRLVTDDVTAWLNIAVNDRFQLYIDGTLSGSGSRKDDTYKFAFPRLNVDKPGILVAASDDEGRFGFLTAGQLAGSDLTSSPENWESLGNMAHEEWRHLSDAEKRSRRWARPEINDSYAVSGDWPTGATRLWTPDQKSGNVLFRYVYPPER